MRAAPEKKRRAREKGKGRTVFALNQYAPAEKRLQSIGRGRFVRGTRGKKR